MIVHTQPYYRGMEADSIVGFAVIGMGQNSYPGSISDWNYEHKIQMLYFHNTSQEMQKIVTMQQKVFINFIF